MKKKKNSQVKFKRKKTYSVAINMSNNTEDIRHYLIGFFKDDNDLTRYIQNAKPNSLDILSSFLNEFSTQYSVLKSDSFKFKSWISYISELNYSDQLQSLLWILFQEYNPGTFCPKKTLEFNRTHFLSLKQAYKHGWEDLSNRYKKDYESFRKLGLSWVNSSPSYSSPENKIFLCSLLESNRKIKIILLISSLFNKTLEEEEIGILFNQVKNLSPTEKVSDIIFSLFLNDIVNPTTGRLTEDLFLYVDNKSSQRNQITLPKGSKAPVLLRGELWEENFVSVSHNTLRGALRSLSMNAIESSMTPMAIEEDTKSLKQSLYGFDGEVGVVTYPPVTVETLLYGLKKPEKKVPHTIFDCFAEGIKLAAISETNTQIASLLQQGLSKRGIDLSSTLGKVVLEMVTPFLIAGISKNPHWRKQSERAFTGISKEQTQKIFALLFPLLQRFEESIDPSTEKETSVEIEIERKKPCPSLA